jgi:hypothetical protein
MNFSDMTGKNPAQFRGYLPVTSRSGNIFARLLQFFPRLRQQGQMPSLSERPWRFFSFPALTFFISLSSLEKPAWSQKAS